MRKIIILFLISSFLVAIITLLDVRKAYTYNITEIESAMLNASMWLMSKQDGNGCIWNVWGSAFSLIAFFDSGFSLHNESLLKAYDYVKSQQGLDGSWFKNCHSTALYMMIPKAYGEDITISRNWILARQETDGSFDPDTSLDATRMRTAYTLYGLLLTGSKPSDPEIQLARDYLLSFQYPDGSLIQRPPWNAAAETSRIMMALALAGVPLSHRMPPGASQ